MPEWSDDLSKLSVNEITVLQAENRAWQRELRLRSTALVNSKLAKQISPEEYAVKRKISKDEADECKRRGSMLANEVWRRPPRPHGE